MTKLNPYINFDGTAREAMEFYKNVLGGKLDMTTFGDSGMNDEEGEKYKIMHALLETEDGMTIMASDTPKHMEYKPGKNISISLSGEDEEALSGYWQKLSDGADIFQPLEKAPWGDTFGMLTDKFGIGWMVNISAKHE
jgi:PhnB protein